MKKWKSFTRRDYEELRRHMAGLYNGKEPPTKPYLPLDESAFDAIATIDAPFFYAWITDIHRMEIRRTHGVKKCLGYDETTFTLFTALNMIHPAFCPFIMEYGKTMYELLRQEQFKRNLRQTTYHIQFPVRNVHGEYYLISQYSQICSVDEHGNATENMNLFSVGPLYQNAKIVVRPRLQLNMGSHLAREEQLLIKEVTTRLNKELRLLTPTERKIALYHLDGLKINDIAEETNTTSANVAGHNRKIMSKANHYFPFSFTSASEVAHYYRALGFLE